MRPMAQVTHRGRLRLTGDTKELRQRRVTRDRDGELAPRVALPGHYKKPRGVEDERRRNKSPEDAIRGEHRT